MNSEEILIYLILIVIGYFIAKMFSRCTNGVDGFSIGGICDCTSDHPDDRFCNNIEHDNGIGSSFYLRSLCQNASDENECKQPNNWLPPGICSWNGKRRNFIWYGTAPLCYGKCPDNCTQVGESKWGDGNECSLYGTKKLCDCG